MSEDKKKSTVIEGQLMSKTDVVVAGTPYAQLLTETQALITQFYNRTLEFYWHLGKRVEELTSQAAKYGNRSLEKFSQDLERVEGIKAGVDTLYDAQKVAKALTKTQLESAKAGKLSMRGVLPMCTKNVTPEMRDAILEKAKNHTGPEVFKVEEAVVAELAAATGGKVDKKAVDSDAVLLKQALKRTKGSEKMIATIENKLKDIGECFAYVCNESDENAIRQAHLNYEEFSLAIDSFNDTMKSQMAKALKAFDKVKEVLKKR